VVGHLTTALDVLDGDTSRDERLGMCKDVCRVRVPTECQDSRMFQKDQLVRDAVIGAPSREPLLERMPLSVGDASKP